MAHEGRNKMQKRLAAILAVGAVAGALAVPVGASAKISDVCRNPGGNVVNGQCNGNPHVEQAENPAGHPPPGHNK
jgi:hypothetical protein